MKAIAYEIIDGYTIVKSISDPTVDPEQTKQEARKRLEKSEEYKTFDRAYRVCAGLDDATPEELAAAKVQLFKVLEDIIKLRQEISKSDPVYFPVPGETNVLDNRADALRKALSELKERELLTLDGKTVVDERGRRAWKIEDSGRWDYTTISKLGEKLPGGYQWSDDLSPVELHAIREQMDRDRIEAMSTDERTARANEEIDAALDAIVQRHLRAQIKGEASTQDKLQAMYLDASRRICERYNITITSEVENGRQDGRADAPYGRRNEALGEDHGRDGRGDPPQGDV